MNLKKLLLLGVSVGWIAFITSAQDTAQVMRFSLAEAQEYALTNNYSVINASKDVEIAKKQNWEYTSIGLPQVSATGNYQNTFTVPELPFSFDSTQSSTPLGVPQTYSFDFNVSQLIFSGQYIVGLQAAKMLKIQSEQSLVKTEVDAKEEIANIYYSAVILKEVIKAIDENLVINSQILNEVIQMNNEGLRPETDVDQFKINVSSLENAVKTYQFQQENSMRLLKLNLGINVLDTIVLTDSINFFVERDLVSFLSDMSFDINSNIDYQIIETMERLKELNLKNEKVQYLPSLSAFYTHQWIFDNPEFSFAYPDMIGLTLSIPIFNSGQKWARVSQAKYGLEKAQNQKTQYSQGLITQFETAKSGYITALNNYLTLQQTVVLSKKIFDNTTIQYREGVASSLDVNQVQREYLNNLGNYYEAVIGLLNAKAHLDRLMMLI